MLEEAEMVTCYPSDKRHSRCKDLLDATPAEESREVQKVVQNQAETGRLPTDLDPMVVKSCFDGCSNRSNRIFAKRLVWEDDF
jgi:hypothetical protein